MVDRTEIVTRSAPRWAWDLIDETLAADSCSPAFDLVWRGAIRGALDTMITVSENPDLKSIPCDYLYGLDSD